VVAVSVIVPPDARHDPRRDSRLDRRIEARKLLLKVVVGDADVQGVEGPRRRRGAGARAIVVPLPAPGSKTPT
jgi:hypothetical protein